MSKDSYLLKDRTEACKRDYIDNLARVGASRCEELGQIERLTEYLRRLENEPIERVLGIEPELELWMAQPLQLAAQAKEVKDLQQYFTERLQEIREKYG